jgi:hypothetical protein
MQDSGRGISWWQRLHENIPNGLSRRVCNRL